MSTTPSAVAIAFAFAVSAATSSALAGAEDGCSGVLDEESCRAHFAAITPSAEAPIIPSAYRLQLMSPDGGSTTVHFTFRRVANDLMKEPTEIEIVARDDRLLVTPLRAIIETAGDREPSVLHWRSSASAPSAGWDALEGEFTAALAAMFEPPPTTPAANDAEGPSSAPAESPLSITGGPLPLTVQTDLPSATVEQLGQITSVLYAVLPNQVTGVLAMTGQGAILLDQLGGHSGLRIVHLPLSPFVAVWPRDLEKTARNLPAFAVSQITTRALESLKPLAPIELLPGPAKDFIKKGAKTVEKAAEGVARETVPKPMRNVVKGAYDILTTPFKHQDQGPPRPAQPRDPNRERSIGQGEGHSR